MFTYRHCGSRSLVLILFLVVSSTALGQQEKTTNNSRSTPIVTATATAEHVRFTAPSNVVHMQLQVISESGQILFDVSSKGNVLDWSLQDSTGQRLQGSYLTVVTVKSLSGRLSQRIGTVSVEEKQVELKAGDVTGLAAAQQQAVGPIEENGALTILKEGETEAATVVAHDGTQGEVTRSRGALSFRLGDFFTGNDLEQMRLTGEGNLGIGTDNPQAKLDVAGTIRTRKGIEFADGTVQTSGQSGKLDSQGNVVPNASGTGTQGRIAKWTDNTGTLGDSLLNESGNTIELRALSGVGVNPTITNPSTVPGFAQFAFYPASGTNSNMSFAAIPRGTGAANNRAQISVFGTDFIADSNNYEFAALRARDNDFVFGSGKSGTGVNRPFMLASGFLADNTTNNGQLYLATNGNVGINTTSPGTKFDVAGNINTSGDYNINGTRVLSAAGTNNFFAGNGAGAVNTGADNSFFGFNAGNVNTTGLGNSFFGSRAGLANTSGIHNSFFGTLAGSKNATAPDNSFFGFIAGRDNTSGAANAFFGSGTGQSNTTGSDNSFFGRSAGEKNTTGAANAFFGSGTGLNNTTGSINSFFGRSAGEKNTTGSDNSFFGFAAGFANTMGVANSFFGSSAGIANTVASDNSFFGFKAGTVSTGSANSFFGSGAGFANGAGSTNSFFGRSAGNANNTGSNNSFFGFGAGTSNTTEDNNTFVGANANGAASITNATAIGANASVAQSNSLVLGSINGVNGATADTNVGIGTTSPARRLHLSEPSGSSDTGLTIQNRAASYAFATLLELKTATKTWHLGAGGAGRGDGLADKLYIFDQAMSAARMVVDGSGNVGIGTSSPAARLDVRGVIIGNSALVQIGAPTANADSKIIGFGDSSFGCGGPCVSIGEADADNRMVLRADSFRVRGGNWNPDIDNANQLGQPSNRWSEVWAVNGMIQTSDARLKQRITNLRYGLNQVMQLRPVTFEWKDRSDGRTHLGLIAQEVERVMPEMIERGTDANAPLGMNYNNLIPVLIKAVQEQQGALERNQAEIKNLRAEKDALSKRIFALEQSRRRIKKPLLTSGRRNVGLTDQRFSRRKFTETKGGTL